MPLASPVSASGAEIAALTRRDFARTEDHERIKRMLALPPGQWADEDVDLTLFRAMTTIMSPAVVPWVLEEFLHRVVRRPDGDWMTDGDTVLQKLTASDFDAWPPETRRAVLDLIPGYLETEGADAQTLADWFRRQT